MSKTDYPFLPEALAQRAGYHSITFRYRPAEMWMLDRAIRQLGKIDYVLVPFEDGIEIWRRRNAVV